MNQPFFSICPANSHGVNKWRTASLVLTGQVAMAKSGNFYGGFIVNDNAAARYVKLYDKATAPTEADTPFSTIIIGPKSTFPIVVPTQGVKLTSGLSARGTTGIADNDTGAPTANDLNVTLFSF